MAPGQVIGHAMAIVAIRWRCGAWGGGGSASVAVTGKSYGPAMDGTWQWQPGVLLRLRVASEFLILKELPFLFSIMGYEFMQGCLSHINPVSKVF